MQARGYSLVEIIVVVCIISILLSIGTLRFAEYSRRYKIEAQTRMLHSEILSARANAVYQRRATRVKLYPNRFEIYSSMRDDKDGVAPVRTTLLAYPIACSGTGSELEGYLLDFDTTGFTGNWRSICVAEGGSGALDSVKVAALRANLGIKDRGDACNADNITER